MLVGAGGTSAFGLLSFNGMLVKADQQNFGSLFLTMIIVQSATPVLYDMFMNGWPSVIRGLGMVLALVAIVLLTI